MLKIKNIFIVFLTLFLYQTSLAQQPGGGRPGGGMDPSQMPAVAKIYGKVTDAADGKPIEYATIAVFSLRDSALVSGGITDPKGDFLIEGLKFGPYKVTVSFIGYSPKEIAGVKLHPKAQEANLGTVSLATDAKQLKEVEVTGQQDVMVNAIDRKVFNVGQNLTSEGGTATDILQNIPSVNVDVDGNVSLRGSGNVTVLIDGKPSGITGSDRAAVLSQIPSAMIESIEVITNPSAKYDPDGMAGIINIKLKKNKKLGINGSVSLMAGTREKYTGSVNLSYGVKKFNFSGSYSLNSMKRFRRGTDSRSNFFDNDSTVTIGQVSNGGMNMLMQMAKLGIGYDFNPRNNLTVSGTYMGHTHERPDMLAYRFLDGENLLFGQAQRESFSKGVNRTLEFRGDYVKKFAKPKQELIVGGNFSKGPGNSFTQNTQTALGLDGNTVPGSIPTLTKNSNEGSSIVAVFQADYTQPLAKDRVFETGIKSTYRFIGADFAFYDYDGLIKDYIPNTLLSNNFNYTENVNAAYAIYSTAIKGIKAQAGLRFEQALTNAEVVGSGQKYPNEYYNLFPSLHLSKALSNKQSVLLSYSKRINRPNSRDLNPFTDYSDPFNLMFGNPNLKPEYTHSYDLGYSKEWEKVSFTGSVYYRQTNGIVRRIRRLQPDGVAHITYENLAKGVNYGAEASLDAEISKSWRMNGSFNFFQTIIDGSNLEGSFNNNAMSWTAKMMSTWKFGKKGDFQLTANYDAPTAMSQGFMNARYKADAAFKYSVMKSKGSISVRFTDIFNTFQFGYDASAPDFDQSVIRKMESQVLYLGFTYRFGKMERMGGNRRKGDDNERGGGGGDIE